MYDARVRHFLEDISPTHCTPENSYLQVTATLLKFLEFRPSKGTRGIGADMRISEENLEYFVPFSKKSMNRRYRKCYSGTIVALFAGQQSNFFFKSYQWRTARRARVVASARNAVGILRPLLCSENVTVSPWSFS